MNKPPQDIYAFYHALIATYGIKSPRALSWGSRSTQLKRFHALCSVGDMTDASILDVGCGVGDLYDFLLHQGLSHVDYTGVDLLPEMVQGSQEKYPGINVFEHNFEQDLGSTYDFALSSGAFSFHIPQAKERYFDMIKRLYAHANKAAAFNILDKKHHPVDETFYAYDVEEVLEFCRSFAGEVTCVRGYLEWDATIYLYPLN